MSECYLLDHMAKGLASLSELQVLKGFVVGDSKGRHLCTLDDLAKLPKLRKLSIYTGMKDFPTDPQLKALRQFPELRKLTIAWDRGSLQDESDKRAKQAKDPVKSMSPDATNPENRGQDNNVAEPATPPARKPPINSALKRALTFNQGTASVSVVPVLPLQLQKLDLQCFPVTIAPNWLTPSNLRSLKKLYIRGGKLCDLGQFQELIDRGTSTIPKKNKWAVEILRLKYLTELEMDWGELQDLFPELIYLEKVKCPKLIFFPCDESGVWMNKTKKSKQLQEMA